MISPPALGLRCEPIDVVRIGLIGLGQRGLQTLHRYTFVEGAEMRCLANLDDSPFEEANALLRASGSSEALCFYGETAWREVCHRDDLDLHLHRLEQSCPNGGGGNALWKACSR